MPDNLQGHLNDPSSIFQCCSPRRKSRILEDQFTSPCLWTSSPCPWTTKSLKIFKDFAFCKLSVMYDHVTSINSITATVHEDMMKNVFLTDVRYYLLIYMSVSKPFFTVTQCCHPQGKSLSLFSRTNLQVLVLWPQLLVLVLEPQVLVFWAASPCPCPQAISLWIQH